MVHVDEINERNLLDYFRGKFTSQVVVMIKCVIRQRLPILHSSSSSFLWTESILSAIEV